MRPVLFELGPLSVHGYGAMWALAALAAWWVVRHELARRAGRPDAAGALTIAALLGGMVGARLYWLAEHLGSVGLTESVSGAGFTWYGGVIGGALATLLVAWRMRVSLPALLGAAAPALAIAYAVGRIGCQLAGDGTYGVPSDLPWAMSYPDGEVPTLERVHPTPVYETLVGLLIFAVLWRLRARISAVSLFAVYLVLSGVARFLVELLRRNDAVVLGLTQPQLFAAAFVLIGVGLLAVRPAARSDLPVPAA
ncbi:MAG: prolipoprotein diacylglyceryl transferase [Solirubrobacteraceae bacterium]|nr:prolipoprotein diacylglyceryl transferase [Solirubrobacteraceae bacterium]